MANDVVELIIRGKFGDEVIYRYPKMAPGFYVAPTGRASGTGTIDDPWDLQTALNHPAAVQPGDTIWLRGGTYIGRFISLLAGTDANRISVQSYPHEWATLDGNFRGALASGITNTAISLTMTDAASFADAEIIKIDSERIRLAGKSGNTFGNCTRGWDGTPAATHSTNTMIMPIKAGLKLSGSYATYRDIEVMDSDTVRHVNEAGSDPIALNKGVGVEFVGAGHKLINSIVHDVAQGIDDFADVPTEIHGCVVYYNGWNGPDRGHGHGLYAHNDTAVKTYHDNMFLYQFDYGLHFYGSGVVKLDGFDVQGNIGARNGNLAAVGEAANLLVAGGNNPTGLVIKQNYAFYNGAQQGILADDANEIDIQENYFAETNILGQCFYVHPNTTNLTLLKNTFVGKVNWVPASYPTNTYHSTTFPGNSIFVRANQYETGRGHIAVFNWEVLSEVSVNLSSLGLKNNQAFEIRDALNYFGTPVVSGVYTGAAVMVPMNLTTVATPIGVAAPAHTAPQFGAFVVIPL